MLQGLLKLFDTQGFPQRWYSGPMWLEEPFWGWLHIISDVAIWGAYIAIPVVLFYFLRRRQDLPQSRLVFLFGVFILCCGFSHLIDALIFEWPIYRFAGVVKFITAAVSWVTVLSLILVIPVVLTFRSPQKLEETIAERTAELERVTIELQQKVNLQHQISQELQDQKEKLRLALLAGGMGTWEWNLESGEVHFDENQQKLTGLEAEKGIIKAEKFFQKVHPEDLGDLQASLQKTSRDGSEYDHEFRYGSPEADYRWFAGRGGAVRCSTGEVTHMYGVNFEITQRKNAEQLVLINEQMLQRILSSLSSFVGVLDIEGRVTNVNRYAAEQMNVPMNSIRGQYLWNCPWWAEDANLKARLEQAVREVNRGQQIRFDLEAIIPDRKAMTLDFNLLPVYDNQGNIECLVASGIDITDRKHVEETLRLHTRAIEFAQNGILITDAQHEDEPIIYCNAAFEELTGYPIEEVLGNNCRFLQGPETDPQMVRDLREAIDIHVECRVTILNYRKNGTPFWNDLRISPVVDDEGKTTHFIGVQTDVSDRMQYEQSLIQARQAADQANQTKSDFLANMSHEIRTPMTSILGCADLLFQQIDDSSAKEVVGVIRDQGQMLLGILNDILDLSKIEAGKLEIQEVPCQIPQIVESVYSLMQPIAVESGLSLSVQYLTKLPDVARIDPLRVRQVLMNLVNNAIKFTNAGAVRIEVACEPFEETLELRFSVIDTGVGIESENLEQIFEAFTQNLRTFEKSTSGTGLGLTICQHLAKMMGGCIFAESQVDSGSRFTLKIPLTKTSEMTLIDPQSLINKVHKNDLRTMSETKIPARVLVAEDTRGIQFLLKRMLEKNVDLVEVVDNGKLAVEAVENAKATQQSFDLILMDVQMPVMNGHEATRQLRTIGFENPIIALTAGAMAGDRERCLEAGCTDYLSKPISIENLQEMLDRYLLPRAE